MNSAPNYLLTSLYVGGLHDDCTEDLYEKFSSYGGPDLTVRVCRDLMTCRSLGYAYVNFKNPADAQRAFDALNFAVIKGNTIRIMWLQRGPSLRKSGYVFFKNMHKCANSETLCEGFSTFGKILNCKVAQDEKGISKGYGYIHFETEEAANEAVQKVNGIVLAGKRVQLEPFIPKFKIDREIGEKANFFTNVYVKNLPKELDDDKLLELFQPYGKVLSHKVMRFDDGKSKNFGFVAFEDPERAEKCCEELNNQEVNGKCIFVGSAQNLEIRNAELKKKFEVEKIERMKRYQGLKLCIKNLHDTVDDEKLKKEFAPYGTITSAKVMTEDGRSKGFGFVCFSSRKEATKAVTEMNGRIFVGKHLYVALALRRENRKSHLSSQYMQRVTGMRMQQMYQMFQPSGASYFMPTMPQVAQRFYTLQIAENRATPQWPIQQTTAQVPANAHAATAFQAATHYPEAIEIAAAAAARAAQRAISRQITVS